jgi:hypothetical protein
MMLILCYEVRDEEAFNIQQHISLYDVFCKSYSEYSVPALGQKVCR